MFLQEGKYKYELKCVVLHKGKRPLRAACR